VASLAAELELQKLESWIGPGFDDTGRVPRLVRPRTALDRSQLSRRTQKARPVRLGRGNVALRGAGYDGWLSLENLWRVPVRHTG
jgi:hypothetical protein